MTQSAFFVGTYASAVNEGITFMSLNCDSGKIAAISAESGIENPSFLAYDSGRQILYAVSETGQGEVYSFRVNEETGDFKFFNKRATAGGYPCHILLSRNMLIVANYAGSVSVFPILEHGQIAEMSDHHRYTGKGHCPDRQEAPHAHSVFPSRDHRFFYVSDLGLDKIHIYACDRERHRLIPIGEAHLPAGAGPRHLAFHRDLPYAYCINELDSSVTLFIVNEETGELSPVETVSALPSGFEGENTCADIHISRCGRFLYGSNRGHDSVAVFRIDPHTGRLASACHCSVKGRTPRNFAISPDGSYLLVANQDSGNIEVFGIDPDTGGLEHTGEGFNLPKPVCIHFVN